MGRCKGHNADKTTYVGIIRTYVRTYVGTSSSDSSEKSQESHIAVLVLRNGLEGKIARCSVCLKYFKKI